jgi:hypothetical protein
MTPAGGKLLVAGGEQEDIRPFFSSCRGERRGAPKGEPSGTAGVRRINRFNSTSVERYRRTASTVNLDSIVQTLFRSDQ